MVLSSIPQDEGGLRFHATGGVRLVGTKIGGQLNCEGGTFENANSYALIADGSTVDGSVILRKGFHATGEVNLTGAKISGEIDCSGGTFENAKGVALYADGAMVDGGIFLSEGFHAAGEANVVGAQIGGDLDCSGGTFENASGYALNADHATVDGSAFLRDGFRAKGEVRLVAAKIGGQLSCLGGTFENAQGYASLSMERASVTATFLFRGLASSPVGVVDLAYAQVGELVDDEASWPENGKLYLDGFVYGRLAGDAPWQARDRLRWLSLQPDFRPQP